MGEPPDVQPLLYVSGHSESVKRIVQFLFMATLLGSFGVWGYAYSGRAGRTAPDTLDERAFAEEAEPICAAAFEVFDELPNAEVATSPQDRAVQVRNRNVVLLNMVSDLESTTQGSDRDQAMITEWLDDWRLFISDREDYANRIAEDENAQFYLSDGGGERLERRITRFANTNNMHSCVTPFDVG